MDVALYDELLNDGDYTPPCTNEAGPSNTTFNDEDDCVVVNVGNRMTQKCSITTGITEVLVDRDFSLEYSYTMKENSSDRYYTHCDVRMRVETVDTLKKWNIHRTTLDDDKRFLRLLLLEIFTSHVLNESSAESLEALDTAKIRLARVLFALLFQNYLIAS